MTQDEKSGSTYRVKAFVEGLRSARQTVGPGRRDPLAAPLHKALAEQSRALREKHPEMFARVQAIKADPNREPPRYPDLGLPEPAECLWCGDFITPDQSYCGMPCALDHKSWTAKRNRPTRDCPSCGKTFIVPRDQPNKTFCVRSCYRASLK